MPDARLQVVIEAVDKFTANLKAIGRTTEDFSKTFRNAGLALTGFGAAGVLAIRSFSNAALDQRRAMAQLQVAISNTGSSFESVREQIIETTLALQNKTNFGDEEQLRALALMVPALGDVNAALAALPTALDLAAATGQDLSTVALQLGRVLSGQQETIRGLPVDFSKAATAADKLALAQKVLGGTAEATLDPFKRMSNAFGELKEQMGEAVLPTVTKVTGFLTDLANAAQKLDPQIIQVAGGFQLLFTAVSSVSGPLLLLLVALSSPATKVAILGLTGAVVSLSRAFWGLLVSVGPWILLAAAVIAAALILTEVIYGVWRAIRGQPGKPWDWLEKALDSLTKKFNETISGLEQRWREMTLPTEALSESVRTVAEEIAYLQDLVSKGFAEGRPWITTRLDELLTKTMDPAFKRMKEQFEALNIPLDPLLAQYEALHKAGLGHAAAQQVAAIWAEAYLQKQLDIIAASKKGGEEILAAMRKGGSGLLEMRERLSVLPVKEFFAEIQEDLEEVINTTDDTAEAFENMGRQFKALNIPLDPLLKQYEALRKAGLNQATAQQVATIWARNYLDTQLDILAATRVGGEAMLEALRKAGVGFEAIERFLRAMKETTKESFENIRRQFEALNIPLDPLLAQYEALRKAGLGHAAAQQVATIWAQNYLDTQLDILAATKEGGREILKAMREAGVGFEEMFNRLKSLREVMGDTSRMWKEFADIMAAGAAMEALLPPLPGGGLFDPWRKKGKEVAEEPDLWATHPWNSNEPTLQYGGIVTRPTRAIIGEAGPEAVIPLKGRQSPVFNVTLTLDGRVLTTVLGHLAENDEAVRSS